MPETIVATADFNRGGYGAKGYLERIGLLPAQRGPRPACAPADLLVHSIPLRAPLPLAQLQGYLLGEDPPDRGKSLEWPLPDVEREAEQQGLHESSS